MTDVKFMDLSQNDNPATTDSVLIGNATNGLKRTTVGAIGNLFAVKGLIHLEPVVVNSVVPPDQLTPTNHRSVAIAAPDVPGYNFLFWTSSATWGAITTNYIEKPNFSSTSVFIILPDDTPKTASFDVSATAVYVKSTVA